MGLTQNQATEYRKEHSVALARGNGAPGFTENPLFHNRYGLKSFRTTLASFIEQLRGGRAKMYPDRVVLTAGATAANEILTFILADPGDAYLVPTPYCPEIYRDLRWRTEVNIVPIHCVSSNNFQITPQALEAAYQEAEANNTKVRAVLITNRLGATIQRSVLEELLDFVTRKNIHLVSDETYSSSVFSSSEFVSVAEILEGRQYKNAERVHIVYSLSKDLGLPGVRVSTIYPYNNEVATAVRMISSIAFISSLTQNLMASMLSHKKFKNYIETNREWHWREYVISWNE